MSAVVNRAMWKLQQAAVGLFEPGGEVLAERRAGVAEGGDVWKRRSARGAAAIGEENGEDEGVAVDESAFGPASAAVESLWDAA